MFYKLSSIVQTKTVCLLGFLIFSYPAFSQPGNGMPGGPGSNFWNLQGNQLNNGQFLGSTNNTSLVFKTNNLERISLLGNGDILFHNFAGSNNKGLLGYNLDGTLINLPFNGNGTKVLADNGSFITNAAISGWSMNGNFLYNATHQVGIGVTAPSTSHILTVNGDALFTGEITSTGLKVLQRIEADTIKGAIRVDVNGNLMLGEEGGYDGITSKYEELRINSRPGYDHNVIINANTSGNLGLGISNPSEKLDLFGNARISGDIIFSGYADTVTDERFLVIDSQGKTNSFTRSNLMQQTIYLNDCFEYTNGFVGQSPAWGSIPNQPQMPGVLYTGTSCPVFVGVGTDAPGSPLDIRGETRTYTLVAGTTPSSTLAPINAFRQSGAGNVQLEIARFGAFESQNEKERFNFYSDGAMTINHEGSNNILEIRNNGDKVVQIESTGFLRAREIKVDLDTNWPDYVFSKDYDLMPLNELKEYIQINNHLPGVPSDQNVKDDGIGLGEMNKILLEKVEELTLHLIDQDETIKSQQKTLKTQQQTVEEQQKLLEVQQQQLELLMQKMEELKTEGGQ